METELRPPSADPLDGSVPRRSHTQGRRWASGAPTECTARLIGHSQALAQVRTRLQAAARTRASVLITGETGTGKSLLARAIHMSSPRPHLPFVQTDCATLERGTIASEIFGHERGAFTGATARHRGRLERAGPGTLFLDEIGELAAELQLKFLRVLQERTFERVGGQETLPFHARVVAATNRDLRRSVAAGRFRADLFFRLNVLHIRMPPLRERMEDLATLARDLSQRLARELERDPPELTPCFERRLTEHAWPGNVRELQNVLQRCLVLHDRSRLSARELDEAMYDALEAELCPSAARRDHEDTPSRTASATESRAPLHLGQRTADPEPGPRLLSTPLLPGRDASHPSEPDPSEPDPSRDSERRQREQILRALREAGGNVSRAARRLGLSRGALRYRIASHGLGNAIPRD